MATRVSRFYVDQPLATSSNLSITGDRVHYIRNVLRLKAGDSLYVFNGRGGEYTATILGVDKKSVLIRIEEFDPITRTHGNSIELGLCILKRDAMDVTLQKATELGVTSIQPLQSDRVTVSHKQTTARLDHWRAIVVSACEQCGLNIPPVIREPTDLRSWCAATTGNKLIADPNATASRPDILKGEPVNILIGPEGGFTPEETESARQYGFAGVYLGARILRAETAAISMLAVANQRLLERD